MEPKPIDDEPVVQKPILNAEDANLIAKRKDKMKEKYRHHGFHGQF